MKLFVSSFFCYTWYHDLSNIMACRLQHVACFLTPSFDLNHSYFCRSSYSYLIYDAVRPWRHTHFTGLLWDNPPLTNGFPSQRATTWSFDMFFDVRLNKHLNTQWSCRWFMTPLRSFDIKPLRSSNIWTIASKCIVLKKITTIGPFDSIFWWWCVFPKTSLLRFLYIPFTEMNIFHSVTNKQYLFVKINISLHHKTDCWPHFNLPFQSFIHVSMGCQWSLCEPKHSSETSLSLVRVHNFTSNCKY